MSEFVVHSALCQPGLVDDPSNRNVILALDQASRLLTGFTVDLTVATSLNQPPSEIANKAVVTTFGMQQYIKNLFEFRNYTYTDKQVSNITLATQVQLVQNRNIIDTLPTTPGLRNDIYSPLGVNSDSIAGIESRAAILLHSYAQRGNFEAIQRDRAGTIYNPRRVQHLIQNIDARLLQQSDASVNPLLNNVEWLKQQIYNQHFQDANARLVQQSAASVNPLLDNAALLKQQIHNQHFQVKPGIFDYISQIITSDPVMQGLLTTSLGIVFNPTIMVVTCIGGAGLLAATYCIVIYVKS